MGQLLARSLVGSPGRWLLPPASERAARLAAERGILLPMARVLAARAGDGGPEVLLRNDLADLGSPFALLSVRRAIERIERALARDEKIFIHGDFDVDGLTSAALLYRALRRLGARQVKVEIGDRARGHGLTPEVVRRASAEGFQLLVTADCGISDVKLVAELAARGVDVIITDHHHPPEELPPAHAIINPKQADCPYPNAELAAVGVIYQTVSALFEHLGRGREAAREYLDLAMLGTVGDLVPLVSSDCVENRILVKGGLDLLAGGGGTLGLRTLLDELSLDPRKLSAGEVSYAVAPKLNAANRVGDPRVAFLLLTTESVERAEYLANILIHYNQDRQRAQEAMRARAETLLLREVDLERDRMIILSEEGWNPGVLGLVASDLAEKYHLPTALLSRAGSLSRGSARSIPEFNMVEGLVRHRHLFERYGGHRMAAGFTIRSRRIPQLKEELGAYAREALPDPPGPVRPIDALLRPEEITLALYEELQLLGPFGVGNRDPRFLLRDAWIVEARTVGAEGRHLKLRLRAGQCELEAIGFNMGDAIGAIYRVGRVDLVFKLGRDEWNGRAKPQLELLDVLEPLK